jgi:beta-N-acetylhexosaminidase
MIPAIALVAGGLLAGLHLLAGRSDAPAAHPAAASPAPAGNAAPVSPAPCDPAPWLASMNTRDKLAQLLMVGVTGADDARAVVANQHVGGIFIGSWTKQSMLTDGSLAQIAASAGPAKLAVSVDEEGGRVQRLSSLIDKQPSARVLAQTRTPQEVYQLARDRGQKMHDMGITVDFAPVVDVTDAPDDTVIGDRSFSPDPAVVIKFAGEYARGLRDGGVLPVFKHFPGHGHASGDSHLTGVVSPTLDEMFNDDLVPYRALVAHGPVGVMVGHMQVPGLTGPDTADLSPASLSPAAYALLRNGSGYGAPPFDGPVFTDDLSSMKAISDHFGVPDAVLKALQAGADTALWITTAEVPAVLDRLTQAVEVTGELEMDNVDASVRRMAAAKAFGAHCGQ